MAKSRVSRSNKPLIKTSVALSNDELALLDALSSSPDSPSEYQRRSRNDLIRYAIRETFSDYTNLVDE